jgi:hypothetical protein
MEKTVWKKLEKIGKKLYNTRVIIKHLKYEKNT